MKYLTILTTLISLNLYAGPEVATGTPITADSINNIVKADYDSGWVAVDSSTINSVTLDHNLNVIPSRIQLFVSNMNSDNPARVVRPAPLNSLADTYHAPENVALSKTKVMINFFSDDILVLCDTGANPCIREDGQTETAISIQSGYMRVLLWK